MFPEVFAGDAGEPLGNAGFDAVLGNPPWDMIRGDSGASSKRDVRRDDARSLTGFVRQSGIYRVEAHAHVNVCQLFVERAMQLARRSGRIGFHSPGWEQLLTQAAHRCVVICSIIAAVESIDGCDNRHRIFRSTAACGSSS
jgi:hypothetical protein